MTVGDGMKAAAERSAVTTGAPLELQHWRILTPWLPKEEAVALLLGHLAAPGEDLSEVQAHYLDAVGALRARASFTPESPQVDHPDRRLLDTAAQAPTVQAAFASESWTLQWVDLRRVQSVQKLVNTTAILDRVCAAVDSSPELLVCVPEQAAELPAAVFVDPNSGSVTISSLNPNLRAVGIQPQAIDIPVPGTETVTQMLGLIVLFKSPRVTYRWRTMAAATVSGMDTTAPSSYGTRHLRSSMRVFRSDLVRKCGNRSRALQLRDLLQRSAPVAARFS